MSDDVRLRVAKAIYDSMGFEELFETLPDKYRTPLLQEADAAIAAMAPSKPTGPTVQVRVAVCVDADGDWGGAGWQGGSDKEIIESLIDHAGARTSLMWLTATLPVPTATEIAATVERGQSDE